jgi:3-phosphoshikimate 1-carboxyvinyltransferase
MKTAAPLTGTITVPGDKSISHRALMLSALAAGTARVTGLNDGGDVASTMACLTALGAECTRDDVKGHVQVEGLGVGGLREPVAVLDAGNSGTTLRCLLGLCAGIEGLSVVTGDSSLRGRPMLRVVAPLRQMGALIDGRNHGDRAPIAVRGGGLMGIDIDLPIASAQVKTAVLFAGLSADGVTRLTEPSPTRDHTERMLRGHGVDVIEDSGAIEIKGPTQLEVIDRWVPGDLSSAMFFIVAAATVPGSDLTVERVGLNPSRTSALGVLAEMGADISWSIEGESGGEPFGSVAVRYSELRGTTIGRDLVPLVIDELPALAVAAARAEGPTSVTGAQELRVKESDRIATLARGFEALGGTVEEHPDGFVMTGRQNLTGGTVDSAGDHRMAMAFAVAGLLARSPVTVRGWSSVETSFPEFLDVLAGAQAKKKR